MTGTVLHYEPNRLERLLGFVTSLSADDGPKIRSGSVPDVHVPYDRVIRYVNGKENARSSPCGLTVQLGRDRLKAARFTPWSHQRNGRSAASCGCRCGAAQTIHRMSRRRPCHPQRLGLQQHQLYRPLLQVRRVLVLAQDALDHQA